MDLNSFHPERVVFMRKEILLPAVAVAGGGAGLECKTVSVYKKDQWGMAGYRSTISCNATTT